MDGALPVSVPYLRTKRLLLREYRIGDFDAFAAHLSDPASTAFIDVADRPTAWRIFCCHTGLWLLFGAGWWAVERADTGELVGAVGAFFRESAPVLEIGWNTYRKFWGQGYATEAATEAVRYAFEVRGEPVVKALITPGNLPSMKVADRLGMKAEGEGELFGAAVVEYRLTRRS